MNTYFITGTGRGIGLEMARQALAAGDFVFASARDPKKSAELTALGNEYPQQCSLVQLDVGSDQSVKQVARRLAEHDGLERIDVLINNAGVLLDYEANIETLNVELIADSFAVNTLGPVRVTQALLPFLKQGDSPVIVNITSLMGSIADNRGGGAYGYRMSKTALNMFTKNLAVDLPYATSVCVHPGWVKTDMGGTNAPLSPAESAKGILQLIERLTPRQSGKFFSYKGEALPW